MDIHLCIGHLGLNRNTYRLTQSNPPHEFIAWDGPDPQPTQEELEVAWVEAQQVLEASTAAEVERKASAKSKLTALGLSEDEISAAFGI
jgi:hypothetical protein